LASDGGTEVEHSPRHHKVKGLNPAATTGIGTDKEASKECLESVRQLNIFKTSIILTSFAQFSKKLTTVLTLPLLGKLWPVL
jgi:hypothetical protein